MKLHLAVNLAFGLLNVVEDIQVIFVTKHTEAILTQEKIRLAYCKSLLYPGYTKIRNGRFRETNLKFLSPHDKEIDKFEGWHPSGNTDLILFRDRILPKEIERALRRCGITETFIID